MPLGAEEQRDLKLLFPFGSPSTDLFTRARWVLSENGAFDLSLPAWSLMGEVSFSGVMERRGDVLELHASFMSDRGVKLTFDSVLVPERDGFGIEALFSVAARGTRQVERITARIESDPGSPLQAETLAHLASVALKDSSADRTGLALLGDPAETVEGVPVPTIFDLTISGCVGEARFGPLSGALFLMPADSGAQRSVSVTLSTEGQIVPGWSAWSTHRSTAHHGRILDSEESLPDRTNSHLNDSPDAGVHVELPGDGKIVLRLQPAGIARSAAWYVASGDVTGGVVPVVPETATIEMRVEGETVTGRIRAVGAVVTDSPSQRTSLYADFNGAKRGAAFVDALTRTVGRMQVAGRWVDEELGSIEIRQTRQALTGTLGTVGARIEGTVGDDLARFVWTTQENHGWGFLRQISPGDMLVGMWAVDEAPVDSILAIQVPPPDEEATSDEDGAVMELRFLANDLLSQGKDRQAVELLEHIVAHYCRRAEQTGDKPLDQETRLISALLPLISLVHACFRIGEYERMIDRMEELVDLQRALSPEAVWRRRFIHWAGNTRATFQAARVFFGEMQDMVASSLTRADLGSTGLEFVEAPTEQGYRVVGVVEGMPGCLAGIETGDVLATMEGTPVAGLAQEEFLARLRGPIGTMVRVGIRSTKGTTEHELMRAPPTAIPEMHAHAREVLATQLTRIPAWERGVATALRELDERIVGTAERDVRQAFADLDAVVRAGAATLDASLREVETAGRHLFRAHPLLLTLFNQSAASLRAAADASARREDLPMHEMLAADADFNRFITEDRSATLFDKGQLQDFIRVLEFLHRTLFELEELVRALERMGVERAYAEMKENQRAGLMNLVAVMDGWRRGLVTDAAKIRALEKGQRFFRRYVRLLVDLGLDKEALAASEAARARAFLDLLAGVEMAAAATGVPPSAGSSILSLATAAAPTVERIQTIVRMHGSPVIEYFIAEDALFVWVISAEGDIAMRTVAVARAALLESVENVVALFESDSLAAENELPIHIERLSEMLVAPVADFLHAGRPITVIPHESLFRLPFAALIVCTEAERPGYLLIENHALVYAPSVAALDVVHRLEEERAPLPRPTLLAFVNPAFTEGVVDRTGTHFSRLETIETAVDHITHFFNKGSDVRVLRHDEATRGAVLAAPPGAEVVLFGTHAEAVEADPLKSYIALADGRLTVRDVATMRLNAGLAMLAACETGRGEITGDGVNGFARFFLNAGTPSLITTLWKVPEFATALQIFRFFQARIAEGASKAESLRAAQLDARSHYPYSIRAWAGFVLVGGWR
jgi:CHAT domain-containing protein